MNEFVYNLFNNIDVAYFIINKIKWVQPLS